MKDKNVAGILALLLGGLGVHKFYTGRTGMGVLYLLFCWTGIPSLAGFIEGIIFLTMSNEAFHAKYNPGAALPAMPAQNIVVNVANTAVGAGGSSVERLKALHELKLAGAISEEEYAAEKRKLLAAPDAPTNLTTT